MDKLKAFIYKYIGSTVMENKGSGPVASMARYMAVPTFVYLLVKCEPGTWETIGLLGLLLGYQGWSKSKWANSGTG